MPEPTQDTAVLPVPTLARWDQAREALTVTLMAERAARDTLIREAQSVPYRNNTAFMDRYIAQYGRAREAMHAALSAEAAHADAWLFELDMAMLPRDPEDDDGKPSSDALFGEAL